MADRDVPVLQVVAAYRKLGCNANYKSSFLTIIRPGVGGIKQHLHKGKYDTIRRLEVRAMYRRLGFTSEQFYAALDG